MHTLFINTIKNNRYLIVNSFLILIASLIIFKLLSFSFYNYFPNEFAIDLGFLGGKYYYLFTALYGFLAALVLLITKKETIKKIASYLPLIIFILSIFFHLLLTKYYYLTNNKKFSIFFFILTIIYFVVILSGYMIHSFLFISIFSIYNKNKVKFYIYEFFIIYSAWLSPWIAIMMKNLKHPAD